MDSKDIDLTSGAFEHIDFTDREMARSKLKENNNKPSVLFTDTGLATVGYVHNINGRRLIIPIPDPTLIYFHQAQISVAQIEEYRNELIEKLDLASGDSETAINEYYKFFGVSTGYVVFLFAALEAFINIIIPDGFEFKVIRDSRTEIYNKEQIELLDFKTKIDKVLLEATGKSFFKTSTPTNERIWRLREFRNAIMHTKPGKDYSNLNNIVHRLVKFNYSETLHAVALFMNFYKPGHIVECGCGKDF